MIRGLSREQLDCGVVAASAGNHAQAVAFAAREAGARAVLVMPAQAPLAKVAAVRQYGGEVSFVDGGYDEAQATARRLAEAQGFTLVHAFDQPEVVAGQGTIGLEIARQAPDVKLVVVPLGRRRARQRDRPRARERDGRRARGRRRRPRRARPTSTRSPRTGRSARARRTRSATASR